MVNLEKISIYWDSSSEVVNGILKEYVFWLNCAHFTVAMMGTKQKLGKYAQQKPLMSFILSYLSCFASGFCVNFLTNIPILASLTSNTTNFSILLLWWLMNFACPKIFDKLYNFPPVLITLVCAKELLRNKKIFAAMDKAIAAYDGNFALAVLVGMCGCCGGGFINHAITCLTSKTVATLKHDTSLATKYTLFFSIIHGFAALGIKLLPDTAYEFLPVRKDVVFVQTIIMAPVMTFAKFGMSIDPFKPLGEILTQVFIKMGRQVEDPKSNEESKKKR